MKTAQFLVGEFIKIRYWPAPFARPKKYKDYAGVIVDDDQFLTLEIKKFGLYFKKKFDKWKISTNI